LQYEKIATGFHRLTIGGAGLLSRTGNLRDGADNRLLLYKTVSEERDPTM
jgi:hypothetical protein